MARFVAPVRSLFPLLRRSFASASSYHATTTRLYASAASNPSIIDLTKDRSDSSIQDVPLESWSGASVDIVLHESFENMIPKDIISLPGLVFNAPVRPDIVHRTVVWQLAKRRAGTSKTKTRSEVSGSGRKIRPQKGTGRSRQGARTSPIFRGGGRVFGPTPRSYDYPLPKNVRRNALRSVLTSKLINGQLWIVEDATISGGKTRVVVDTMDKYGWSSAYIVDDFQGEGNVSGVHPSLYNGSNAVKKTLAMNVAGINVYDALSFNNLVLTTAALNVLKERFEKYDWLY